MKKFVFGFVASTAVIVLIVFLYFALGVPGFEADVHASAWKNHFAEVSTHASIERSAVAIRIPQTASDQNLISGGKLYMNGCAGCHGHPTKARNLSRAYFVPPLRFALAQTQYTESEVYWIVKHGIRRTGMSAYGPFYSDEDVWDLAAFVKQIRNLSQPVLDGIEPKNP